MIDWSHAINHLNVFFDGVFIGLRWKIKIREWVEENKLVQILESITEKAKIVRKWNQSIITIVIQIQILETTSDPFSLSAKIVKTVYGGVYTTDTSIVYSVAAFSLLLLSQTVLNAATRCLCCGCKEGQSMNGKGMRRK
ncbi:hypothetical protein MTR_4g094850 [Medicago truncatula]|uniref:Uncharacterized protein n=1 Tax=Medicago truncatula TaxID=3880 RepID=A0A072UR02_MEDTR|nr:hypothetical protein MTR_4g094850 [Medicago truncatula]